jgi:hypothetical protein
VNIGTCIYCINLNNSLRTCEIMLSSGVMVDFRLRVRVACCNVAVLTIEVNCKVSCWFY